jgi:hypothetical protein
MTSTLLALTVSATSRTSLLTLMGCPKNALAQWLTGVAGSGICAPPAGARTPARDLIHRIGCNDAMNDPSLAYQGAPVPCRCFNNGAPKMSAMKFHVGDRVEDKKTHERGRVTFVYSTLELRDEFIAVLSNHDEALDVPPDSVRKVATRQS